jgi:hypothetical protein
VRTCWRSLALTAPKLLPMSDPPVEHQSPNDVPERRGSLGAWLVGGGSLLGAGTLATLKLLEHLAGPDRSLSLFHLVPVTLAFGAGALLYVAGLLVWPRKKS